MTENKKIKFDSWESFWKKTKPMLGNRIDSFQIIFDYLSEVDKPSIVETGTYREENNITGDGMSTVLFDTFIEFYGGKGVSIDIDKDACKLSDESTKNFQIINENSLTALSRLETKADLLYLDSFDVDWNNPLPAATHHLKELFSARNLLKEGTLIVIDDNILVSPKNKMKQYKIEGVEGLLQGLDNGDIERRGKGQVVLDYMNDIGVKPLFDMYQMGWIWNQKN